MTRTGGLEALLRRDRRIVLAALVVIVVLAWSYLFSLGAAPTHMDGTAPTGGMDGNMDMTGHGAVGAGTARPMLAMWSAGDILLMFLMWAVMMVGMMTPSAAPMVLIYARVARGAQSSGKPFAASGWFAAGYLLAWTGFAALATAAQWGLESAALLTPAMATASPIAGAVLLVVAGIYQWTPLKYACLAQCQSPFQFIQRHGGFRGDSRGALSLGARHGLFCIGCCWALMLLLFFGGVMNLLWIAALAVMVMAEKLLPVGHSLSRAVGVAFVIAGIALAAGLFQA